MPISDPSTPNARSPAAQMSAKLRAALDYLGDRLSTHRDSRFKPAKHTLLDAWVAARRTVQPASAHSESSGER